MDQNSQEPNQSTQPPAAVQPQTTSLPQQPSSTTQESKPMETTTMQKPAEATSNPSNVNPPIPAVPNSSFSELADHPGKKSSVGKFFLTLFWIIVILGLMAGSYYLGTMNIFSGFFPKPPEKIKLTPSPVVEISPSPTVVAGIDTSNWLTYTSSTSGYSLQYPPNWNLDQNYKDPQGNLGGKAIALTDTQGDQLIFETGFRPLGVPPHVFKTEDITIDSVQMIKAYNDGCDFAANGRTAATATCKTKPTQFYAITYSTLDGISSDPTVVDSKTGTKDYEWSTGSQSVSLGMSSLHNIPAYLSFILKQRLSITDTSFQPTDMVLDKIISSIKFTK